MSSINSYLNYKLNNDILSRLGVDNSFINCIITYNDNYLNYPLNSNKINEYIKDQLNDYVNKNYSQINVSDADINYYLEKINLLVEKKYKNIIDDLNLTHIISLYDYHKNKLNNSNNIIDYNIYWKKEYYKLVFNNILCGKYKIHGSKDIENLIILLEKNWNKIKFDIFINFSNSLSKIKFFGVIDNEKNMNEFIELITHKFDDENNLKKIINYIINKFNDKNESKQIESNLNLKLRFLIDCLKSNGYLLFEEFNKYIKNKYKKNKEILTIKTDQRIINYFIYLISKKDSNLTNRKVNEILLSIKNYLEDLEESYNNNIAYKKITVKQESDKYKSIDLSSYDRDNADFIILKYSNITDNKINNFMLDKKIEPYFDIYKSYYNSRYPDRCIEFDPIMSSIIVKMIFNSKNYYIHLALIQYIVMDKLFNVENNSGLNITEISSQTNIEIKNLQQTINSLLQIKLIKHSLNTTSIADIKFYVNYDFEYQSNKISIYSLVIPKDQEIQKERELMHDRNIIILSNLYDYIKKNKIFTIEKIYDDMSKNKIPFKIDLEQIISAINVMVEKEDIIEINENNVKTYKYCEC